jgi:hypothetical protein
MNPEVERQNKARRRCREIVTACGVTLTPDMTFEDVAAAMQAAPVAAQIALLYNALVAVESGATLDSLTAGE